MIFPYSILEFLCLSSTILAYVIPEATVEQIIPKGFRLSIPHEEGITEVSFNVKINQRITLYQPGDFAAIISEPTDNRWAFDNVNTIVARGSRINYWVHVQFGTQGKNFRDIGSVVVSDRTIQLSTNCKAQPNPVQQECPTVVASNCELSITTVQGIPVCKEALIFEESFDDLNPRKWDYDVRIPLSEGDGQFVSFQKRPENAYVQNGQLHILPTLLSDTKGFNLSSIRSGYLDLEQQCSPLVDRSLECKKEAINFQILPPVVSTRIRTKNSFNFRYGTVEIVAKLPRGDWLFPVISLEPFAHYYGINGYTSGRIIIAFNRGNPILLDDNNQDISNKFVFGGVKTANYDSTRPTITGNWINVQNVDRKFHTYTLKWTEDALSFGIDGAMSTLSLANVQKRYKYLNANNFKTAPFDREFFLTLGISVGGHTDFPDKSRTGNPLTPKPWTNGDPKAELNFWKDRANWLKTWEGDRIGLHVDHVRVYAL